MLTRGGVLLREEVALRPLGDSDPTQVGPYRLLAELGRGGMGRVLLAGAQDGRLVAVKLVRDTLVEDEGFRERFRREVAASRKVSGAYTAPVIDDDPDAPTPWLASVFVIGPSLQRAVEDGGVLSEEPALRLAAGLVAALAEVHQAGLVHRDLKPANVLLAEDGPRVIDFGIARATENETGVSNLTSSGWIVGSPPYMSPELIDGREPTPAGDVFSLGAVLVMACTGASPFAGSSPSQALYRVVHAEPDLTALPSRVRPIAAACLAKDPSERPDLARLREMIGDITASAMPWPAPVNKLIIEQRAEIARLLETSNDHTVDLPSGTPTMAATRAQLAPPFEAPYDWRGNVPPLPGPPVAGPGRPAAGTGRTHPAAVISAVAGIAALLALIGILAWAQRPASSTGSSSGDTSINTDTSDTDTTDTDTDTSDTDTTDTDTSTDDSTTTDDSASWDNADTDDTPFTEDALLPDQFTDDNDVDFVRVAGGPHPCSQAASGPGPFRSSDVVQELTDRGCSQVMTGTYLEESGSGQIADNPVLVSIQVFPLPDDASANDMKNYLATGARWNLSTWCTKTGVGSEPCARGASPGTRVANERVDHRYLISVMADRTDLTYDNSVVPSLNAAVDQAVDTGGPETQDDH